ncbi:MAG: hypothetical protein LBT09_10655 [Planctomycetaceae bacterium]|jgi:hypothetical protein|nr:hypothetical protein [Planctomycetaceae bacterium]
MLKIHVNKKAKIITFCDNRELLFFYDSDARQCWQWSAHRFLRIFDLGYTIEFDANTENWTGNGCFVGGDDIPVALLEPLLYISRDIENCRDRYETVFSDDFFE